MIDMTGKIGGSRRRTKTEKKILTIENEITQLEETQKELDLQLADPDQFKELTKDKDFFSNYESKKTQIQEKEKEWESLVSTLNNLKTQKSNTAT